VFASGEGEEVVLREHLGQTAVVRDQSRGDTTETSDLDNVDFLVKEACIINVKWISLQKHSHRGYAPIPKMKNVTVRKKNRTDKPIDLRSEPMLWEKNTRLSAVLNTSDILTRSSSASAHKIN
jgi:hypothetical protein